MMRPHCDRCDTLIEGFPRWVEINSPYDDQDKIYHIEVNINKEEMFCKSCWITILLEAVTNLQGVTITPAPETEAQAATDAIPFRR